MTTVTREKPRPAREAQGPPTAVDEERLDAFRARFAADQAAALHLSTVVLGDQLGLYRELAEGGPQTGDELAVRTGYVPRLVLEWLRAQTVSGYCDHDPGTDRFWLTPEQQACLADDGGPAFVAGGTSTISAVHRGVEQVAAAFRGEGDLRWGDHDPGLFSGVARGFTPAFETHIVASWIPALDGVDTRLRQGGKIADVACGFGVSTVLMAQGYPDAIVAGFDLHDLSIEAARRAAAAAGVTDRVTFEVAAAGSVPGGPYDLVTIFNALHEMGDPVAVCRRVGETLADGGQLMLVEPLAPDSLAENHTPVGRSFLSASTMVCLPSALSQGGDRYLGAQAPDGEFAEVALEAGFARCARVAETPLHRVLQLTP